MRSSINMWESGEYRNYLRNMIAKFGKDYDRRRRQDGVFFQAEPEEVTINPLAVEGCEFYINENATEHHTDQFELVQDSPQTPVLRRGQNFYLAVRFDRELDPETDMIRFVFNFGAGENNPFMLEDDDEFSAFGYVTSTLSGPKPAVNKNTRVILQPSEKDEVTDEINKWDARIQRKDGNVLMFEIKVPATTAVGIWKLEIHTSLGDSGKRKEHRCKEDIYVLFNPWCREDTVFLEDEDLRKEYVLNDTGKVWMGSYRKPYGRRWIFGQFDDAVLPTCMYLLEQSQLQHSDRGNAIQVSRAISAVINSLDDNGLLTGRWDGNYRDGVSPHAWTGSVAIMEKYLRSGGRSVKYGQCWVFSASAVTVCRALGIPCRTVTNYVSAHDTNRSLTVDKYFDERGEEIHGGPDGECYDSCWNFHVWTDVWMARPDLPAGYGGWQIIDATPQEESESVYRCGPASVEAVRRGEVGFSYDTPFVFAEVNADVCHFQENRLSEWGFSRLRINQYHVGRKIVTKKPDVDDDDGDDDMEDVTYQYKNQEGSQEERLAVFNAVRGIERAQQYYDFPKKQDEDVWFDLEEIDTVPYGESFNVTVHIHNKSDTSRTISAILSASSVYYTGSTAHRLKRAQGEFVVNPQSRETLQIQVTVDDYLEHIVDHGLIKLYAIANVKETRQTWSEEDDFPLLKPKLTIAIHNELAVGQESLAVFTFTNPLPVKLTNCTFSVEGPGLQRPKLVQFDDVDANAEASFTESFRPKKSGVRKIMATFNSKQLSGVSGSTTIDVSE